MIGFAMICLGGYLLLNQVSIVGSYWGFYGPNTFGITLVPMLVGVSILFWSGRSTIVAGAITAPRLVDARPTRTLLEAGLLGAGTSLLALMLFAPFFALFLFTTDVHPAGPLSYIAFPILIAIFAFVGDGWALFVTSIGIGWALYGVASAPPSGAPLSRMAPTDRQIPRT